MYLLQLCEKQVYRPPQRLARILAECPPDPPLRPTAVEPDRPTLIRVLRLALGGGLVFLGLSTVFESTTPTSGALCFTKRLRLLKSTVENMVRFTRLRLRPETRPQSAGLAPCSG